jgi:hypothetical protein
MYQLPVGSVLFSRLPRSVIMIKPSLNCRFFELILISRSRSEAQTV